MYSDVSGRDKKLKSLMRFGGRSTKLGCALVNDGYGHEQLGGSDACNRMQPSCSGRFRLHL